MPIPSQCSQQNFLYLNPVFFDVELIRQVFTCEHVRIVGPTERQFQLVQLMVAICCPSPLGLLGLIDTVSFSIAGLGVCGRAVIALIAAVLLLAGLLRILGDHWENV